MQIVKNGAGRGVYAAPWMGPNGEIVLLAITKEHKLAGDPVTVPVGASHHAAADALWERLDADDPIPGLRIVV